MGSTRRQRVVEFFNKAFAAAGEVGSARLSGGSIVCDDWEGLAPWKRAWLMSGQNSLTTKERASMPTSRPHWSAGVAEGALAGGVVEAGEAGGGSGADDFAGVEDLVAGVGAGDDDAAEGVAGALEEAAVAEGVVAVVLVGDGGDDGFDEEVFAGLVDDRVPEVAAVGDAAGDRTRGQGCFRGRSRRWPGGRRGRSSRRSLRWRW